ncbi:hypothetical protein PVA45_07250 (plasmid) [Entomospira entomophila]|uniref:Uncharacterized protein n=1 Tax=Entomospira entomophila TaxID=2719988 RepID=A0A968GA17_9SPIO|nr:hypothetical protein [Entomospira entomophilus]NIZ41345.1 hypothetical protein [Entomospira entomophilus]WDI36244.1 hypothetical protein PVA45_07250 [Entomospira entomophilus]
MSQQSQITSLAIIQTLEELLQSYRDYRRDQEYRTFTLSLGPKQEEEPQEAYQINLYLATIEPLEKSYYGATEQLTYYVDIHSKTEESDPKSHYEVIEIIHHIRHLLMELSRREREQNHQDCYFNHPEVVLINDRHHRMIITINTEFAYKESDLSYAVASNTIQWNLQIKHHDKGE